MPGPEPETAGLDVRLLGPVEAWVGGLRVELRRGRQELLLAALALQPGHVVTVGQLVDVLWPAEPPLDPANAVQHLVAQVRRALGAGRARLVTESGGYRLTLGPAELDVARVQAAVSTARTLLSAGRRTEAAAAIAPAVVAWRGRSLGGPDEGPLVTDARRLDELRTAVELVAADVALAGGTADELNLASVRLARECEATPLDESLWARRIAVLARSGRPADALAVYESVRRLLVDELGVDPSPELQRLHGSLLRQDVGAATATTAGTSLLPASLTTFLGRSAELALLSRWYDAQARLVSIVGPGGVGKTRLAVEFAKAASSPVVLVRLDAISGASDVTAAVAATLVLREIGTREMVGVIADSLPADALLVLDNAEHVLGAVAQLATRLLEQRADLRVLVTSQWPLRVSGERLLRLGVLPVEGADTESAAALLLDRAAYVRPELATPDRADREAAASIAKLLDGLPLALELAAAQAGALPLPALADTLRTSLILLDRGSRTANAERHAGLSEALEWSLRLLDPDQRRFFVHLAVLAGDFDSAAAAAVTGSAPGDAFAVLLDLADRSVVQVHQDGPDTRFRVLRPLRARARRELEERADRSATWDRLLEWVVALAENGDEGIRGPAQSQWLRQLDAARADVENALDYALEAGRVDVAGRVVAALGRYWDWRGRLRDADRWTAAVIGAVDARGAVALPRLGAIQAWRGFVAFERGELDRARALSVTALASAERADDDDGRLTASAIQAMVASIDGPPEAALAAAEETLRVAHELDHHWGRAWAINRRGLTRLGCGLVDGAASDATDSDRRFGELGDRRALLWARHLHALVAHARGDRLLARSTAEWVRTEAEACGDLRAAANAAELLAVLVDDGVEQAQLTARADDLRRARTAAVSRTDVVG